VSQHDPPQPAQLASPSFSALARLAQVGQVVCIRTAESGESSERCGVMLEIHADGVVLESDAGTEWVAASVVHGWRVLRQSTPLYDPAPRSSAAPRAPDPASSSAVAAETTGPESNGQSSLKGHSSVAAPADLELLFAGEPVMTLPSPTFEFPTLERGVQQEINRWRNRYDYAQKVREPARMTQDIAQIADLAESLAHPGLYQLAGVLAFACGLGAGRARDYVDRALTIDPNSQESVAAAAALAIGERDWSAAASHLLRAIRLEGPADKTALIRLLGQCVLRLDAPPDLALGLLLSQPLPDAAQRLIRSLVAHLVRSDPAASSAAQAGDVARLRETPSGLQLFRSTPSPLPPEAAREGPAAGSTPRSRGSTIRRGRVSTYYDARNFGFIVEELTGQTWFMHRTSISSDALLRGLKEGKVRQEVTFSGNTEVQYGRYPEATGVAQTSDDAVVSAEPTNRAPLRQRLQAIPRDRSSFARAMEAEQLDQLGKAELLYGQEISTHGKHLKSAIKNLAALTNRTRGPEAAIELLDTHRAAFDRFELNSVDQLRVQFLVKARKYSDAAAMLAQLARSTTIRAKRIEYLRQEAYCVLAAGDFEGSIRRLEAIVKTAPSDNASVLLLAKAREAQRTGVVPVEGAVNRDEEDHEHLLSSLALGLSAIAREQVDNCELRGLDARTKESGEFTSKDFQALTRLLETLKGRRPRERADYLLTLAKLCELAPDVAGGRSPHLYLRWHFCAMAETALLEGLPTDCVRCYAVESLVLCPAQLNPRDAADINEAWALLLRTYVSEPLEPGELLRADYTRRFPDLIRRFAARPADWQRFVADAPFFALRAPFAYNHLLATVSSVKELAPTPQGPAIAAEERARLEELGEALSIAPSDAISADRLRQARDGLAQRMSAVRFALDRERLGEFIGALGDAAGYALERHFRELETRFLRLESQIARAIDDLHRHPTHFAVERLLPALRSLSALLKADFSRMEEKRPDLELRNVLDRDFYVLNDGAVALRLMLSSRDESAAPMEAIGLVLEEQGGSPCHSPEPLHGGQAREIELIVRPSAAQIVDGAFTVTVRAEYRTRRGHTEKSPPFLIAVRLGDPAFEDIANPYGRYAGGSPVEDEGMFFGRATLVDRVEQSLSSGSLGQCFVLYGQKRSGKSSVLKQVEKRLASPVLFASMSAGTFSPGNLWSSFARLLLQELTFRLEDSNATVPPELAAPNGVDANPIETILRVARGLSRQGHRIVVAIDEFTYIYENVREGVETFMRGWKALLEARTFSALLVGQDTMPRFKQAFPNEFGVTHDERLTYLDEQEAAALATQPILFDGRSRYRGQALRRLFSLTAGSPFFLQIACDRLVRHLNARKAPFVTEADIDQIARTLTIGGEALPPERFDALVTAAGERVAAVPREDLWRVLARAARDSLHSGWCYRSALAELTRGEEAVRDLVDREVLEVQGDRVSIRVGLFAAWLRANQ
jgi:cold shock CspA family protein